MLAFSIVFVLVSQDYKNSRYKRNFNVIQDGPIDFWICAFVIKNIVFFPK